MGTTRDSNLSLLMKANKPTPKKSIIDTKHTLLGPVYIWVDHQLQQVKHLLTTPAQDSQ